MNVEPPRTQSLNVKTNLTIAIHHDDLIKKPLVKTSEEDRKVALLPKNTKSQKTSITQTSNSSKSIEYSGNDSDSIKAFVVLNHQKI